MDHHHPPNHGAVLRAVAQLLRACADSMDPQNAGTPPGDAFDDSLYGDEDMAMAPQYHATPEGGWPLVDEDTIVPASAPRQPFDPHDLPLDKYENSSEKQRQMDDPQRRAMLRDAPLTWMDQAVYYAHQMADAQCDAEEAARCFLCLPGGPVLRRPRVAATKQTEYDALWQEAQGLIQTAYDSDRLDAVDLQDCLLLLGEPFDASRSRVGGGV